MRLTIAQIEHAKRLKGSSLTQREAAKLVGCSQSQINRLWNLTSNEKARLYSSRYRKNNLAKLRKSNIRYHQTHKDPDKRKEEYAATVHDPVIYVAYSALQGLVKIGVTRNVTRRRKELRIGGPDIEILRTYPGQRSLELKIHDTLSDRRFNGTSREWFRITPSEAFETIERSISDNP